MTHTIWKYPLKQIGRQTLLVPAGATLLKIAQQRDSVVAWFWVDPSQPKVDRTIITALTGFEAPSPTEALYRETAVMGADGDFVLHYFEEPAP